jgi:phage-related holin
MNCLKKKSNAWNTPHRLHIYQFSKFDVKKIVVALAKLVIIDFINVKVKAHVKRKVHPRTGHESLQRE